MDTNEMKNGGGINQMMMKRKKKSNRKKFGCFRSDYGHPTIEDSDHEDIFMESAVTRTNQPPTHLVIMVNGMNGSAQNWRFAAKQILKKFLKISSFTVISVIKCHSDLQKISFIGHSLGGLVARYAIAKLYSQELTRQDCQENKEYVYDGTSDSFPGHRLKGRIAGLEPVNFITLASPHLGSRGHRQVPMLCGVHALEELVSHLSWFLRRTGKHLFLTDGDDGQPPLLLQMVSDHEDLKFISALRSFKRRVVYANIHYDYVVGWSTSSIRRQNELLKNQHLSKSGTYPHVLKVEMAENFDFPQEGTARVQAKGHKIDELEEIMIRALTNLSWERVDVSFKGSRLRYFAHNLIQVKGSWISCDGADVVQHMVDHFHL